MAKRFLSALIASMCALSMLSAGASAAVTSSGGTAKLNATGTVTAPVIHVRVPTKAGFIANPYKMKVKVNGKTDPIDSEIIGSPFEFISESNVALDVYVSAQNTVSGNAKLLKAVLSSALSPMIRT